MSEPARHERAVRALPGIESIAQAPTMLVLSGGAASSRGFLDTLRYSSGRRPMLPRFVVADPDPGPDPDPDPEDCP